MTNILSDEESQRSARNIILPDFGVEGQLRLRNARVLIVGTGGLGSPIALYLAAAGVGTIGIADGDVVDRSNLQRQIIHNTSDINRRKVLSAKEKIERINPNVNIVTYDFFLSPENVDAIVKEYDIVASATDTLEAKYLVNDSCVRLSKPFCHGGVSEFEGQIFTFVPGTACYRCIFGNHENSGIKSVKKGILGSFAGMVGTIQATEIIKYITGIGKLLTDTLLLIDIRSMSFNKIRFSSNNACRCVSSQGTDT